MSGFYIFSQVIFHLEKVLRCRRWCKQTQAPAFPHFLPSSNEAEDAPCFSPAASNFDKGNSDPWEYPPDQQSQNRSFLKSQRDKALPNSQILSKQTLRRCIFLPPATKNHHRVFQSKSPNLNPRKLRSLKLRNHLFSSAKSAHKNHVCSQ